MAKFPKLLFLLLTLPAIPCAQPANDDCAGAIHLGTAPACPSLIFSNVDATASDIGAGNIPACFNGGNVERDAWFAFTTSDTIFDYTFSVTGLPSSPDAPISNPQIALYRGDCTTGLAELACASAGAGAEEVELDVEGLTPNVTYFLRVNDYSPTLAPNWGAFQICVEEKTPENNIDEGGSTACSGALYDSGGPGGDYSNNESHTFTICPDEPHGCIRFTLDYYLIEPQGQFGVTDLLTFYDGPQASPGNIIGQLGSFNFEDDGGGGVCYEVVASSGCLTVGFTSDNQVAFEGFRGRWECTNDCEITQPITTNADISDQQVVDFVSTPETTVDITSIDCPEGAYGTFLSDPSGLGLERGLLLTTGNLAWAAGPNDDAGMGNTNADNGAPGDPELDYLSQLAGNDFLSNNACIVELDVFAATNELTFEYIFASEEYQEFVGQEYNDIFAFLISGPGIIGDPNINNQSNIAVLPDGNGTPVEINSVNQLTNWQYYRNNNNGVATQYDGLTSDYLGVKKSLTARASVTPCNTYHLKLAIADRGDALFDSGVFISELKGGTPRLSVNFNNGIDYLVEGCTDIPDELVVALTAPSDDTIRYRLEVGGTATRGPDYILDAPDTVVFLPGQASLAFPITVLADTETETIEIITIRLTNNFGCGDVVYTELQVNLADELRVEINAGQDTAFICEDNTITLQASGAGSYFWTPVSVFSNPSLPNPVADPPTDQWVTVEGVLGPCVAYDSIFLRRITPMLEVEALSSTVICRDDSVQLVANNNVSGAGLQWAPATALDDDPSGETQVVHPQASTTYTASLDVTGCILRDSVYIDVAVFDFPGVVADTTICENYGVRLASTIHPDSTTTRFTWAPSAGLANDTIAGPVAFPSTSTAYQLIGTAANGACADTAEVNITVLPADVTIANPDTVEICRGAMVDLSASTTTGDAEGLLWSPDDGSLSETAALEVTATPEISTWYFATYELGPCTVFDSVYIRVDSLPALSITADPEKEAYCQGEIVQLTSPVYEPAEYPAIEHLWMPSVGFETGDSLWNMVIRTQDTTLYQRITTNRVCRDTAEILINVIEPPLIKLSPQDTAICIGGSILFQLEITGGYESVEWTGNGLSCNNCLNPTATPPATASYSVMITADGCEPAVGARITVVQPPVYLLNGNPILCSGESLALNLAADSLSTYTWTSTDPSFGTVTDSQPVVSPASSATYYLTADNGLCPPVQDSIRIEVAAPASLQIEGPVGPVCVGAAIQLSATVSGGTSQDQFLWQGSDGSNGAGASVAFTPGEPVTYTLTYISGGCNTLTASINVVVNPALTVELETDFPDVNTAQQGDAVTLTAITNQTSPVAFTWTLNQEIIQQGTGLFEYEDILITDPSTYTVFAEDAQTGCRDSASLIYNVAPPIIDVPNAFTPNGDGHNDFFAYVISGNIRRVLEFRVFNRWGQLVFESPTEDPGVFIGWDGTFKGKPQPSEVYFYLLRLERYDGLVEVRQGDVSLLR